jgi:pyruvate dehydrogenase E2 component (dihydrolipoamide acetyltransferase)
MAITIEMPKLSDTMSVGTVVKWHKNVGEQVSNGDTLAEIETDKATMELENFDDGVLLKILVNEGEEAPIGSPLALVGEEGEEISETNEAVSVNETQIAVLPEDSKDQPNSEEKEHQETLVQTEKDIPNLPVESDLEKNKGDNLEPSTERIFVSPLARKIASEKNIDLSKVVGSGPSGRIIKKDILGTEPETKTVPIKTEPSANKTEAPTSSASQPNGLLISKSVPLSGMRSVIARRLSESKSTIPHFYLQKEINIDSLLEARIAINLNSEKQAKLSNSEFLKISVNDLILKACAESLKWHPEINSSWGQDEIIFHEKVELAFGVAVDGGLLTPIIREADRLSLSEISREAKSLISLARDKKLSPDAMSGSTFTVTNLGMYDIDFFSGIINPPNAAILSVGASIQKPIVDKNGNIVVGRTLTLGLSCDHRLVDGAMGASFLGTLSNNLENPSCMLV